MKKLLGVRRTFRTMEGTGPSVPRDARARIPSFPRLSRFLGRSLGSFLLGLLPSVVLAEVRTDWLFRENMVLQREMKTPVWGTASAGETVTVKFAGQTKAGTADAGGNWLIRLDPMKANAVGQTLEITGDKGALKYENVLIGDIWFCSGQSNMAYPIFRATGGMEALGKFDNPQVRVFGLGGFNGKVREPQKQVSQHHGWYVCTPETAERNKNYSAVAFFFAQALQPEAGVPLGIIGASLGGSMAEAWISEDAQRADPKLASYVANWDWMDANVRTVGDPKPGEPRQYQLADGSVLSDKEYGQSFQDWRHAWDKVKPDGEVPSGFPADFRRFMPHVTPVPDSMDRPGIAYNCMLAPLLPFGIKGVIWYQGEANAGSRDARDYEYVMGVLIREWRKGFASGDFPFLIVQLPNFNKPVPVPVKGNWATLREQQSLLEKNLPGVHVAVTIDMADPEEGDHWHPANKRIAGERLALVAAKHVYGRDVAASGPRYHSMRVEGNTVRVKFTEPGGGLEARPPIQTKVPASATPGSPLKGFAVAGEDRQWAWADARIEGDEVVVWSESVPRPVAVRYGWQNAPTCNLYNKAGLPAAPFRSDDWPLVEEFE